jgi:hypothetical protein
VGVGGDEWEEGNQEVKMAIGWLQWGFKKWSDKIGQRWQE